MKEIVDFILKSTNDLLKKHFNTSFNDKNIKVFDAFTGTGSFITRLLDKDNALINDENLKDKFQNAIFAQDIVLLSYYITLINITQTAKQRDNTLSLFKNIALTDSLDYLENKAKDENSLFPALNENKKIKSAIENQEIRVIVGNPPYSSGAESANDNNANISHPNLEIRVKETYGKESKTNFGSTTRDSLIQAIRMASDKISEQGIISFVVNGSFIDSISADGFRKCIAKDFSNIYIFNLRGNSRTQFKEIAKKEGGNVFDTRITIAIIFLIKDSQAKQNQIHYYDIGDYLSKEEKLLKIKELESAIHIPFRKIIPNKKGDWINQRGEDFEKLIPLKSQNENILNDENARGIFTINSNGLVTNRDSWAYNFSKQALKKNMQTCINTYNDNLAKFNQEEFLNQHKGIKKGDLYKYLTDKEITTDKSKIAWTRALKNDLINNIKSKDFTQENIRIVLYRPFTKQYLYYDKTWNEEQGKFHKIFPKKESKNIMILISGSSSLIADSIIDYHTFGDIQVYPLYYYEEDSLLNSQEQIKQEAIRDYALKLFQEKLKDTTITKKEIFYYIYAIFHHKGYLDKYKTELTKESPRIMISKDFKILSKLGEELASLHLNMKMEKCIKTMNTKTLFWQIPIKRVIMMSQQ